MAPFDVVLTRFGKERFGDDMVGPAEFEPWHDVSSANCCLPLKSGIAIAFCTHS